MVPGHAATHQLFPAHLLHTQQSPGGVCPDCDDQVPHQLLHVPTYIICQSHLYRSGHLLIPAEHSSTPITLPCGATEVHCCNALQPPTQYFILFLPPALQPECCGRLAAAERTCPRQLEPVRPGEGGRAGGRKGGRGRMRRVSRVPRVARNGY